MDVHVNVRSFFLYEQLFRRNKSQAPINEAKPMNYSKTYLTGAIRI